MWHPGAHEFGRADLDDWHPSKAPSPDIASVFTGQPGKEMDEEDIARAVERFGRAAELAQAGGLDGIEISGGHGYLPCQFLSPMTNTRTDRYGGSVENRCRFTIEVLDEIRRRCGREFVAGIRLSFDEFVGEAGLTPERSEEILRVFDASGLFDFYDISGGNYHSMHRMIPTLQSGLDGHLAAHSERARAVVGPGTPVFVASAVRSIERAAEIVERGQADLVAMTRAHLADPGLVGKARAGRATEILRCVGANQGCLQPPLPARQHHLHRQSRGGPRAATRLPARRPRPSGLARSW